MSNLFGVKIKELEVHQDIPDVPLHGDTDWETGRKEQAAKPGFLIEVLRDDDGLLHHFGQTTFTVSYKGTIKAFHWHKNQDDLWFVATGRAMVVLYDMRGDSPTFGKTQTILAGENDYKLIFIPVGVAHGYKVMSEEPVLLFYHTTRSYDPTDPDEERIPWNDPRIDVDWDSAK